MADAHHDRNHHESDGNAPLNAHLGFDIPKCTCCGVSVHIVGSLGAIPEWPEHCEFCGRQMQASVRLEEEAMRLVRPWVANRTAQGISSAQLIDELAAAVHVVEKEEQERARAAARQA